VRISTRIDDERHRYRKATGREPERVVLTQDQYMQLGAEHGQLLRQYKGLPIVIRWGATANKAITL
jgi:hypothetical protein